MKQTFRENLVRVVAVLGLIAVLLLGAWGIIQIAFYIPSLFGNAGSIFNRPAAETLTVQVASGVSADQPFPIAWKHTGGEGAYSFALSYACIDGLSLLAPVPTGTYQPVACNTPFNYVQSTSSMPLVALVQGTKPLSTTFTVTATQLSSGAITKTATATLSVNPSQNAAAATPAASTTVKKPAATTSTAPAKKTIVPTQTSGVYQGSGLTGNLYGNPDLTVRIIYAVPNYTTNRAAVQFVVENIGTNAAPYGWTFDALIPFNGGYPYNSGAQPKLYPGDKIVYTLGYQNDNSQYTNPVYQSGCLSYATAGCIGSGAGYGYTNYPYAQYNYNYAQQGHTVVVTIDQTNQVYESNESNNAASATY